MRCFFLDYLYNFLYNQEKKIVANCILENTNIYKIPKKLVDK
jgi:hypothetical protein